MRRLAARQQRLISRDQVYALGGDDDHIARRLRAGILEALTEKVLAVAPRVRTFEERVWAAALDCDGRATISHESAGRLEGLTTLARCDLVVVTIPHATPRTALARCHQTRRLLTTSEVVTLSGLPVTSVARTIVDLATVLGRGRIERILDDALAARVVRLDQVVEQWLDARSRHLPVRDLGALLALRGPGWEPATSELNRVLHCVLSTLPGPAARLESAHPGEDLPGSLVDAQLLPERIVVEADGRRWHSRVRDFARDRQRDRSAASAGYVVARYTYDELTKHADVVLEELAALRARRRSDLGIPPLDPAPSESHARALRGTGSPSPVTTGVGG